MVKLDDLDGTLAIAVKGKTFKMDDKQALVKAVLTYTGVDINTKQGRRAIKSMQNKIVDQIQKNPIIVNSIEKGDPLDDFDFDEDKLPTTHFNSDKEYAPYKTAHDVVKSLNPDFDGPKDLEKTYVAIQNLMEDSSDQIAESRETS